LRQSREHFKLVLVQPPQRSGNGNLGHLDAVATPNQQRPRFVASRRGLLAGGLFGGIHGLFRHTKLDHQPIDPEKIGP
jgi:hypothetical protein